MEVFTPNAIRRSTRIRVEIPVNIISMDRRRPFAEDCLVLVASAQGCGFRSSQALPIETPIMINGLPGGKSVTGKVANCLPLGSDGKYFLIGAALYTHGNVWGISDAPADWNVTNKPELVAKAAATAAAAAKASKPKQAWPYNLAAADAAKRR